MFKVNTFVKIVIFSFFFLFNNFLIRNYLHFLCSKYIFFFLKFTFMFLSEKKNMKRLTAKLVFMGSQGVGKSSIITRYIKDVYKKECEATIGASFMYAKVTIQDYQITLKVWDTAGQERFRSLVPMYYRNVDAVAIIFDVSDRESFDQVKIWINEVKKSTDTPVVYYIVGNKTDLMNSRTITFEEAKEFTNSVNANYWETSVYTNTGIQELFTNIGRKLIELVESSTSPISLKLEIDPIDHSNNPKVTDSKISSCCTN